MKRFKTYLNEGWGQVKKEYVKTGKMISREVDYLKETIDATNAKNKGLYIDWIVRWWVKYQPKYSSIRIKRKKPMGSDKIFSKNVSVGEKFIIFGPGLRERLVFIINDHILLTQKNMKPAMLPVNKSLSGVEEFLDNEKKKNLAKLQTKIKGLKKGKDYNFIALDEEFGVELYEMRSRKAAQYFGKGTKWCIASEDHSFHWLNYNDLRFYYAHSLLRNDEQKKIAIGIDDKGYPKEIRNTKDDYTSLPSDFIRRYPMPFYENDDENIWEIQGLIDLWRLWKTKCLARQDEYFEASQKWGKEKISEIDIGLKDAIASGDKEEIDRWKLYKKDPCFYREEEGTESFQDIWFNHDGDYTIFTDDFLKLYEFYNFVDDDYPDWIEAEESLICWGEDSIWETLDPAKWIKNL